MKEKIISIFKNSYQNIRIANIKQTGILATRALVGLLLVPILLVVVAYMGVFIKGYVSDDIAKVIDVGIKIIDHIFIPSVLTALVGFLALFIDNNNDGVPDKLEEPLKIPQLSVERSDRNEKRV